jgi:SAM-dependent methyltransferase
MARAADSAIGDRTKVLELGVGTGLFAQSLAETKPDRDITGVDFTPSMLEIAQDRVGPDARLIEADVTSMDLGDTFDAAISSGGVWVIIDAEHEFLLGTHLFGYDDDVEGLTNVSAHLKPGGLLLLSIQEMHRDFDLRLPGGVVYSQRIFGTDQPDDHFMIEKQYRFTRGSEVLGKQTLNLGFYRRKVMDRILGEAGFEFEGIDDDRQFFVYSNRGKRATTSVWPRPRPEWSADEARRSFPGRGRGLFATAAATEPQALFAADDKRGWSFRNRTVDGVQAMKRHAASADYRRSAFASPLRRPGASDPAHPAIHAATHAQRAARDRTGHVVPPPLPHHAVPQAGAGRDAGPLVLDRRRAAAVRGVHVEAQPVRVLHNAEVNVGASTKRTRPG